MIPITREEYFLAKITGEDVATPDPITRVERYYNIICGNAGEILPPITREEIYLAKIAGLDIAIPEPKTRIERYLASIAGGNVNVPAPITRKEKYLEAWLNSGSLPEGYTQVEGFTFNSDCYFVVTGLKLRGSDTAKFSMIPAAACNVFGCYTTTDATDNYSLYVSTATNAKYLRYNGGTYKSRFANSVFGEQFNIVITPTGSHGMPEGQNDEWEEVDFEASVDMCIGTTATNATSAKFKGSLIGAFVVDGRFKGIPCKRDSDDALGYYDLVTKTFFEPEVGTPTVVS